MTNLVTKNKAVYFTYRVTDQQGNLLEQSDLPIGYVHGVESGLLAKIEQSLEGHAEGDHVEIPISPDEGFGKPDPNLIYKDSIKNVPPEYRHVGAEAQFQNESGEVKTFIVTKIDGNEVTMDGNHPYAGQNIIFNVTIKEIRDAELEEISSGRPKDLPPSIIH